MSNKLSTSALAKKRDIDAQQLFKDLSKAGYLSRHEG